MEQHNTPASKLTDGAFAGASVAIGAWALNEFGGIELPAGVEAAMAVVVASLIGYYVTERRVTISATGLVTPVVPPSKYPLNRNRSPYIVSAFAVLLMLAMVVTLSGCTSTGEHKLNLSSSNDATIFAFSELDQLTNETRAACCTEDDPLALISAQHAQVLHDRLKSAYAEVSLVRFQLVEACRKGLEPGMEVMDSPTCVTNQTGLSIARNVAAAVRRTLIASGVTLGE